MHTRPQEEQVILERIHNVIILQISDEIYITFREEWVEKLRTLPYSQFGEFIRSTIYPALSEKDQNIWNRSSITNRDLHNAVQSIL